MGKEQFEQDGLSGKLKVTNWKPPTGIGCFDGVYDLQNNQYDITIKVFYDLIDGAKNQGFIPWDETSRREFKQRAKQVVEENWSERYDIACAKPGWEKYYAKVKVHFVEETTKSRAHLHLEVKRRPENHRSQGGGVDFSATPPKCDIDSLAVVPKDQANIQQGIFNMRERMIIEALKSRDCELIGFDHKSANISIESKLKLLKFAQYVGRIQANDVKGIQVHVFGSTSGRSFWGTGKKRAKAVRDFIAAKAPLAADMFVATTSVSGVLKEKVISVLRRKLNQPIRTNTKFSGAVIVVHTPEQVNRLAEKNYIVLVHEIGHVLGLPDEYFGRLHPKLTKKIGLNSIIPQTMRENFSQTKGLENERRMEHQMGMYKMYKKAGSHIAMPIFMVQDETLTEEALEYQLAYEKHSTEYSEILKKYGRQSEQMQTLRQNKPVAPLTLGSSSIMFGGMDIMPAHYLTIWSSLAKTTAKHLQPTDWKIVPSGTSHSGSLRFFQ